MGGCNLKVAIIQGGHSSEAEISRMTSLGFQESLKKLGHEYRVFEYERGFEKDLINYKPETCLLALHGTGGEDGVVQGLLEYLGLNYTGSEIFASSLSFNKKASLDYAKSIGVPVLEHLVFDREMFNHKMFLSEQPEAESVEVSGLSENQKQKILSWDEGFVVKPVASGSSRGVTLCSQIKELNEALIEALKWSPKALIEKRVNGRELTVGVFKGQAFDAIEIKPKKGFYDIKNKYTQGATDYLLPAPIQTKLSDELKKQALKIFEMFQLKTYGRVDFIATPDESDFYFIEVNSLPGCTPTSLLPKALAYKNISFEHLIQSLLDESLS